MGAFWKELLKIMMFWKKPENLEEEKDYRFVEVGNDLIAVEIITGKFSGIIYSYGKVKFEQRGAIAVLNFDFNFIDTGDFSIESLTGDQELINIMGDILTEVLISQKEFNEKTRRNDTKESDI